MSFYRVLFVCIHNSSRSQMAEAFLKQTPYFQVDSAGIEPGLLNPYAVKVMQEVGIDISHHQTKSVFDLYDQGNRYDAVISVCDPEAAEKCPIFPGKTKRYHWTFPDPLKLTGSFDQKCQKIRMIRNEIDYKVRQFVKDFHSLDTCIQQHDKLFFVLKELMYREPIFHHPEKFGKTKEEIESQLCDEFFEVGASGHVYNKQDVIEIMLKRYNNPEYRDVWQTKEFDVTQISKDHYLLTYLLIQDNIRVTRRSTIWRSVKGVWKILYHQGTLCP